MNETIYRATQMQVQDTISDKDTSTRTQVNIMKSKNTKQDDKRVMLWSLSQIKEQINRQANPIKYKQTETM